MIADILFTLLMCYLVYCIIRLPFAMRFGRNALKAIHKYNLDAISKYYKDLETFEKNMEEGKKPDTIDYSVVPEPHDLLFSFKPLNAKDQLPDTIYTKIKLYL